MDSWFFYAYNNLKSLSCFEYQLTMTDFKHYFEVYPIPFSKITVISILKTIDKNVAKHNNEIKKAKSKNAKSLPR